MKTNVIASAVPSRCPACAYQVLYDQAWAVEIAKERGVRT